MQTKSMANPSRVPRPRAFNPLPALATLAALTLTFGLTCGLIGAAHAQPATAERAPAAKGSQNASASDPAAKKRPDWTRLFTADERAAWQQKIDAAPDETARKRVRGQRLAEIQRRSKQERLEAEAKGQPAVRATSQTRQDASAPSAAGQAAPANRPR